MAGPEHTDSTHEDAALRPAASRLAVIGGTGLINSSLFSGLAVQEVHTPHGTVCVHVSPTLVYVNRHHTTAEYAQPGQINHRATFCALQQLSVTKVLAVCSVGSLTLSLPPGSLLLPDDYFGLLDPLATHYHDDYRAHIVPSLCPTLRRAFVDALTGASITPTATTGVYVQTRGPRFETPAEIRFIQRTAVGDVIGMTAGSEATVAAELKMPYQPMCMVDNYANGIGEANLTLEEFKHNVAKHQPMVERAVQAIVNDHLSNKSNGCGF